MPGRSQRTCLHAYTPVTTLCFQVTCPILEKAISLMKRLDLMVKFNGQSFLTFEFTLKDKHYIFPNWLYDVICQDLPPAHPSHSCQRDTRGTPWGVFFNYATNVHLDSQMNGFDCGGSNVTATVTIFVRAISQKHLEGILLLHLAQTSTWTV